MCYGGHAVVMLKNYLYNSIVTNHPNQNIFLSGNSYLYPINSIIYTEGIPEIYLNYSNVNINYSNVNKRALSTFII